MSKVPLFTKLPDAWMVALLSEWLDLPSIGMLDTGVSSKKHRPQFLSSLRNMRSTSLGKFICGSGGLYCPDSLGRWEQRLWRWLSVRRIHAGSFFLRCNSVRSDLVIPSMRKVTAESFEYVDLYYLIHNCPSLRFLSLELSSNNRVDYRGVEFPLSLEEFTFRGYSFTENSHSKSIFLVDVLRHCSHLQKVSLTGDALLSVDLDELLPYGHLFHELWFLCEVSTIGNPQIIANLLSKCSNLKKLRCDSDYDEQASVVVAVIYQCPLLKELVLASVLLFCQQEHRLLVANIFSLINIHCNRLHRLTLERCEVSPWSLRILAGIECLKELILKNCDGLCPEGMTELGTMKLTKLSLINDTNIAGYCGVTESSLHSLLVGSNISQTLELFNLSIFNITATLDDVQVATALSSCHQLKSLAVPWGGGTGCVFGRNGLGGLEAMATGCPLLADINLDLTASGVHYVGTHFTNLQSCKITLQNKFPTGGFLSAEVLQTLYPLVKWTYGY